MTITELKPDIDIVNDTDQTANVPFESNIKKRKQDQRNKCAHFRKGITTHKATITTYEVGSRGYLTTGNKQRLYRKICNFCEKGTKPKQISGKHLKISPN